MTRILCLALLLASSTFVPASAQEGAASNLDSLVARHASAYNVPEALVRRVIKRESGGNARAVSKGNYGLMQIRLGTARAMGYRGGAEGLLDADTNMTYAVKYLAGAYHAAGGNHDRAVQYYAAGYYYAAKRKGLLDRNDANPIGAYASAVSGASVASVASDERGVRTLSAKKSAAKDDPAATAEKVDEARDEGKNVTSGSDIYTGRLDYF